MIFWVQITSGSGPAECRHAVLKISEILIKEARNLTIEAELVNTAAGEDKKGAMSCLIRIEGENAASFTESWKGTILWRCQSPYRAKHKRKNWYVGVNIFSPAEDHCSSLEKKDFKIETMRSSGPGGQHANKTESAVRIIHLPTGLSASAQEERSQYLNKKLAISRVMDLLEKRKDAKGLEQGQELRSSHYELERGNPTRTYSGMRFSRS